MMVHITMVHEDIYEATIAYCVQCLETKTYTAISLFHVLMNTGPDKVVLGTPWLRHYNLMIDWKTGLVGLSEPGPGGNGLISRRASRSKVLKIQSIEALATQKPRTGKKRVGRGASSQCHLQKNKKKPR
jgi:hypothetical protein